MTIEESLVRVKNAMKIGEYGLAESLLKKVISVKTGYSLPFMLLGNVYERTGKLQKAIRFYKQSLHIKPDNVEACNNLGVVYKNLKEYEKALAFLNRALLLEPRRPDIYYNLGNVYKETGDLTKAITQYEKSISINSGFIPAFNNLGTIFEMQGNYEEAGKVYQEGLEADENNPRLHYNLGIIYEKQNKLIQAKEEFESALKRRPGWDDALLNLGVVLSKLSKHDQSINTFRNILKIDPGNVKAINNLGIEYGKVKNPEKAKFFYNKALQLDPDYKNAHLNLGTLLEDQGDLKGASATIETLVQKKPEDIPAHFRLASIYTAMGTYDRAEEQFRFILQHHPDHSDTLRALGNLYLRMGNYTAANECYTRLSQTDPDMTDFHLDFAVLLNDKNEFSKSEAEVKKFLSFNPDDMNAQLLLGELYFKQGFPEKAVKVFESIIEKKPNIVKPYYYLAKAYKEMGASGKAIEVIDKLITLQGTRQNETDMGSLGALIRLYESATKEYEKEFKIELNKKIAHLDDFAFDKGGFNKSGVDGDSLSNGDDADTIMKTGGKEPIIPVKETLEQIKIIEVQKVVEEKPSPVVEIKDAEPFPLTDLLRNQDLYDNLPERRVKQKERRDPPGQIGDKKSHEKESGEGAETEKERKTNRAHEEESGEGNEIEKENNEKTTNERERENKRKQADKNEYPDLPLEVNKKVDDDLSDVKRKENSKTGEKNMSQDMFDTISKKLDNLMNERAETAADKDTSNETLLNVLKNISEALKEKKHPGPFPAFYLPAQKKRVPRKKKPHEKGSDSQTERKKSTRERLKDFFHNIRKKLAAEKDIKIPEDKRKLEYINTLFDKVTHSPPFDPTKITEDKKPIDTLPVNEITIIEEKEDLYGEGKTENRENSSEQKIENNKDMFISKEPVRIEKADLRNDLVLEEEFLKNGSKKEQKDDDVFTGNTRKQTTHTGEPDRKDPEKIEHEKSFKPVIRVEPKRESHSVVVNTLQFLRKLIHSIPGIGINTGIKSRLDNLLKKLIK